MLREVLRRHRFFGVFASGLLVACVADVSGEKVPDTARLYFPGRMSLSSDGHSAFVVNTNFDQRFVTSWLTQVDLQALIEAPDAAAAASALQQSLHVPSLGGPIVVDGGRRRAYMVHRGQGLLTAFDIAAAPVGAAQNVRHESWHCGSGSKEGLLNRERATDCDAAHLSYLAFDAAKQQDWVDDPNRDNFADPFTVVQHQNGQLSVAFLGTGQVAQLALGDPPRVARLLEGPADGGLTDLTTLGDLLLGAGHTGTMSSTGRTASALYAWRGAERTPTLFAPSARTGLGLNNGDAVPEVVRMLAEPSGAQRLFFLTRRPDTLSVARLATQPESAVENGAVVVRQTPARLRVMSSLVLTDDAPNELAYLPRKEGNLVVVSSFARDTLAFYTDRGDSLVLQHRMHLAAGRGPAALLPVTVAGRSYLLVTTFFDHGLDVIDVSAADAADFRLHVRVQDGSFKATNRAR